MCIRDRACRYPLVPRALGQNGPDARDVAAHCAYAVGIFQLAAGALKTQIESLLAKLLELALELVDRLGAHVANLHDAPPSLSRVTIRVLIGSFAAPNKNASFASAAGTPSSSNRMRPGFTRATQNSGEPLPLPMRTSAGFTDTGTSGKIRIHTRPTRRMWRVMARREASIWRAVTRPGSMALRPNAPKFNSVPPLATP